MKDIYKEKMHIRQIFTLLMISIIFVLLLTAIITIAFFSQNKSANGNISLGELDFCLYETGSLDERIVPGDNVNKQIKLVNSRNNAGTDTNRLCSIFVKYEIDVDNSNQVVEPFFTNSSNWTVDGNILYYNGAVAPGQVINLCDSLIFSANASNEYQNQTLNITFNVSAIQAENRAYLELWPDAPQSWKSIINQ